MLNKYNSSAQPVAFPAFLQQLVTYERPPTYSLPEPNVTRTFTLTPSPVIVPASAFSTNTTTGPSLVLFVGISMSNNGIVEGIPSFVDGTLSLRTYNGSMPRNCTSTDGLPVPSGSAARRAYYKWVVRHLI